MKKFSIIIPTWNNLSYLQLCISSIQKNSYFKNQIIVYVNEGKDGTLEWLKRQNDIDFLSSADNQGICIAVNSCRPLIRTDYIIYMNDDMYVCPNWDLELHKEIEKLDHDKFMFSATLIEPYPTSNVNAVTIVKDFGDNIKMFDEAGLLMNYQNLQQENWFGASWPPSIVSTKTWDIVGGYSIEFSPGMYSDPDFSMKLWKYGVRVFKGIGTSKVYHFQSKSTNRFKKNKGSDTFLMKWGITAKTFYTYYLRMGKTYSENPLQLEKLTYQTIVRNKLKRLYKVINFTIQ
jgi:glycosyltransferase involved in cell wall biosynthesis